MSWSMPLELDAAGRFPRERPDPLADTARLVLAVAPGERPLLPGFGWGAHRLPSLATPVLRQAAAAMAEEALRRWAPQLGRVGVEVAEVSGRTVTLALRREGGEARRIEVDLQAVPGHEPLSARSAGEAGAAAGSKRSAP